MSYFFKIAQKRNPPIQITNHDHFFSMQWGPLSCEGEKAPIWRCRKTQNPKTFQFFKSQVTRNSCKPRKPCNIEYCKWHNKRPGHLLNFWGPQGGVKYIGERGGGAFILKTVTSSTKLKCFRQKYQGGYKNEGISTPSIDTSRSSTDPYRSFHDPSIVVRILVQAWFSLAHKH